MIPEAVANPLLRELVYPRTNSRNSGIPSPTWLHLTEVSPLAANLGVGALLANQLDGTGDDRV